MSLVDKLFVCLLTFLMFSAFFAAARAYYESSDEATVYVHPKELKVEVGEVFNIYVNIRDVSGLQGFDFMLKYNTAFLDCSALEEGTFLSDVNHTFVAVREIDDAYDETWGRVWLAVAIMGEGWADGNGTLATVTFKATEVGESALDLYSECPYREDKIKLFTCCSQPIENTALDGYVIDDPPSPADPLVGDVNDDGIVDMEDITIIANVYGTKIGDPGYVSDLDLDQDGIINLCDLLIAAQQFGLKA